ncbi:MAG: hypothetical protein WD795_14980 [Woeseia sp.]
MTATAHLVNYDVEYNVELWDAILMGLDCVEHQLTLGSGGPRSAEMQQMVDLMLAHDVYYDANLQMYGGIYERRAHEDEMLWTDEANTSHRTHGPYSSNADRHRRNLIRRNLRSACVS